MTKEEKIKELINLGAEDLIKMQLRYIRKHHKMTQLEFAKLVGLSQRTIARFESSKGDLSLPGLLKIADSLDIGLEVRFVKLSDIEKIQKHILPKPYCEKEFFLDKQAGTR